MKKFTPEVEATLAQKREARDAERKAAAVKAERKAALKLEIDSLNAQKAAITKRLRELVPEHDAL